jgi:hypothetical protein
VARSSFFSDPKANHVLVLHKHETGSVSWLESWTDEKGDTLQRDLKTFVDNNNLYVMTLPVWWTRYLVVDYRPAAYLILAGSLTTRLYSSTPTMDAATRDAAQGAMLLKGYSTDSLVWSPCAIDGFNNVLQPRDAPLHPRQCSVDWME